MIDALSRTRSTLEQAHKRNVRSLAASDAYSVAARIVAALLAAAVFDLLFPLENPFRAMIVAGLAIWAVIAVREIRRRIRTERVRLERVARIVEQRHPEVENAFINAIQFGKALAARPDDATTRLMEREIDRAEQMATQMPIETEADRSLVEASRGRLWVALAIAAASLVLFPRAWRFEVPRFLLFWADYPPFTLTDFHIAPGNAHVRMGGLLEIHMTVGGLAPDSVTLVTVSRGRRQTLPLDVMESGGYSQTLNDLTDDTDYYAQANTGRSTRFHIMVDRAPEVRAIRATIHPPAYTKQQAITSVVGADGIRGLTGARVGLEVDSSRPLAGAAMQIVYPDRPAETVTLAPAPRSADRMLGGFVIRSPGTFRISLSGADGQQVRDAAHGPVNLLRDERPIVSVIVPGRNAMVTPDMQVPIQVGAEDDVGIDRIELHRLVNNMSDSAQTFSSPPGRKAAEVETVLDLKDLGVRPGDVIQYYATAFDNDPGTHHLTDSDRYWLWVVSPEDYKRILGKQRGLPEMAAQYRALTDSLRSLSEAQRNIADRMAHPGSEASMKRGQQETRKQARELARQMRSLAAEKPQYDIERALKKKLLDSASQIDVATASMRSAEHAATHAEMARDADRAANQLAKASGKSDRSIGKALEALEKIAPLHADVQCVKLLAQAEAQVAMQARDQSRKPKPDPYQQSRLQELAQRQAEIREKLAETQRDLESHADDAQSTAPAAAQQARRLSQAIARMAVADRMAGAEWALRSRAAGRGAEEAEEARRELDGLFRQGQGTQSAASQALDDQLSLSLGEGAGQTLEQLAERMSLGAGQGRGLAQSQAGNPTPRPGSRPGDGDDQGGGQSAMALSLQQESGSTRRKKQSNPHVAAGERPATLGSQDVERLSDPLRKPPTAADSASGRYPIEYRRLVKDYFRAVAGGR